MDCNKLLISIFFGVLSSFIFTVAHSAGKPQVSPIGYWKTMDELTGKPKSIIHIWKTEEDVLMGKVIKLFAKEGRQPNSFCNKCKGNKYNQPIIGMVVLSGLKANANHWSNGEIFDPENGKSYNCNLRTVDNGKRLHVENYLGLPLLGRSETWERVDLMSG